VRRTILELFNSIVDGMEHDLMRRALGITHDRQLAEDACQEGYLELYRALDKAAPINDYRAWLRRVVATKALAARSARRPPGEDTPLLLDSIDEQSVRTATGSTDPGAGLDLQETLARLPTDQQTVVSLRLVRGLSCREIAAMLKCSERTVQRWLEKAIAELRQELSSPD